jgi:DNA-binding HxlR family transcriptional regulator
MLLERTHRFSELRRAVGGVSEKMLAQTLDALAHDGLVLRVAHQVVPPHVEYSLTPLGRQAAERLEVLVDWIEENFPLIKQAQDAATLQAA